MLTIDPMREDPSSRRGPSLLALGVWLASRGPLAAAFLALTAACTGAALWIALMLRDPSDAGAAHLATRVATGVAWSAGVTSAVGAALGAVSRDLRDGVVGLARARGATVSAYLWARTAGLAIALSILVGCPALLAAIVEAGLGDAPLQTSRDALSAVVYALAFAATLAPVVIAAIGVRGRVSGYALLLLVLVVPEVAAPYTVSLLPAPWRELTSLPAALDGLSSGVAFPLTSGPRALRGLATLAVVTIFASIAATSGAFRLGRLERARRGEGA